MLRCDFLLDLHMPHMNISCDKQANINLDKWESKKAPQEIIFTQASINHEPEKNEEFRISLLVVVIKYKLLRVGLM